MGTVCSATLLWGLVDLDVLDNEVSGVETLGVGVGLSVLEETEEELGGLDWPSGAGDTKLLSLSGTTGSTSISSHWDSLLVLLDVLKELNSSLELPSVDGLCGLAGVLERNTKVGTARAGGLGRGDLSCCVTDLRRKMLALSFVSSCRFSPAKHLCVFKREIRD